MNKKGQLTVASIITVSLGLIILAYLFIPQIQQSTVSQSSTPQTLNYNTAPNKANFTLTNVPIDSGTLSLTGLTLGVNYSILSSTTGLININATNNITSTANYKYYTSRYLDSASDRTLYAVLITVAIAGAIYMIARMFGMV